MVWSLEIHHIGLNRKGDATLIIASNNGFGQNQQVQMRTMLIDGGMFVEAGFINHYINGQLAVGPLAGTPLNVMVVTHYDTDHCNGIRALLNLGGPGGPPNIYDNVIIFDQGASAGSNSNQYIVYTNAIGLRGARSRVTGNILGINPPIPVGFPQAPPGGWQVANTLLNQEIMWTNAAGAAVTPATLLGAAVGTNLNPPTVTCIAVNQFVQGAIGRQQGGLLAANESLKNEHSLGFIVQFNNFRYYIAGDLEIAQENQVQNHLNPADDLANRVIAIHTSHHGGNTSTSRAFVDQLKPDAAFISCGNANQHFHPSHEVVNVLDGYPWNGVAHAGEPPPSPNRPVSYYLTGYQIINALPNPPQSQGDPTVSMVAGDPQAVPRIPGHIVVTVTHDQSINNQRGEFYFGVREATCWAAQGAGAAAVNAITIGLAAANAIDAPGINSRLQAVQAAVTGAATAAGATHQVIAVVTGAAGMEASGAGPSGVNYTLDTIVYHTATQARANGATLIQAAAAGAAAGAAFVAGERNGASRATRLALLDVGIGQLPAYFQQQHCWNAINAAVGVGLFDVSFYDYFAGGQQNINHSG